jgi:photosynthetic reaction center cytochrome c subunit
MTQHINTDWKAHVAATGVTCYTCHRGNPVPKEIWFTADSQPQGSNFMGNKTGQNTPANTVKLASLPYDPFTPYLLKDEPIRVNATKALPTSGGEGESIQRTEKTYALMTHMSASLGVNCTYCHNTQNFGKWDGAPPQRVTAWHGIRMARDLNLAYMEPLTDVFPSNRKGELGDVAKMNCATCHQGAYKPLLGVSMLKDHPELAAYRPYTAPAPAAPDAAAAPAATATPAQ